MAKIFIVHVEKDYEEITKEELKEIIGEGYGVYCEGVYETNEVGVVVKDKI